MKQQTVASRRHPPARVILAPRVETDPDFAGCGVVDDGEAAVPNWRTRLGCDGWAS